MDLNRKRSRAVAEVIGAANGECWKNALLAVAVLDEALYVEGWVVTDLSLLVEHGWVEADGEIVDPTPAYHAGQRRCRYFPGVRYTLEEAMSGADDSVILPLAKLDVPAYRAAYSAAHVVAYLGTPEELQKKLDVFAQAAKVPLR